MNHLIKEPNWLKAAVYHFCQLIQQLLNPARTKKLLLAKHTKHMNALLL